MKHSGREYREISGGGWECPDCRGYLAIPDHDVGEMVPCGCADGAIECTWCDGVRATVVGETGEFLCVACATPDANSEAA